VELPEWFRAFFTFKNGSSIVALAELTERWIWKCCFINFLCVLSSKADSRLSIVFGSWPGSL